MNRVLELTKAGNPGSRWTSAGMGKDPLSQSKTTSAALADPPIPISTRLWNEAFVFVAETSASSLERRKISENAPVFAEGTVQARSRSSIFGNIAPIAHAQPSQHRRGSSR